MDGKKVLISTFKNEAPFVLEFVAHHIAVGFDEIIIASNDCTDGTADILAALDQAGLIHHLPCTPVGSLSPQSFAYAEIRANFAVDRADWLMILDADEFLNIHVGQGRLKDLVDAQETPELILINWACFGSGQHQRWVDEPSCCRFVHRLRTTSGEGHVKSLIRTPAKWNRLSNHHPIGWGGEGPVRIAFAGGVWVEDVPANTLTLGAYRDIEPTPRSFDVAQINHYATRTLDSFELRRRRGRGAALPESLNTRHVDSYFRRMACGKVLDLSIARYAPQVAALMAEYRSVPSIDRAVSAGIRLYQDQIVGYWREQS